MRSMLNTKASIAIQHSFPVLGGFLFNLILMSRKRTRVIISDYKSMPFAEHFPSQEQITLEIRKADVKFQALHS